MKLTLSSLEQMQPIDKVCIHALESSLYCVTLILGREECWLAEEDGSHLTRNSLTEMRELLAPLKICSLVLCHRSAYDEMIGHPVAEDNLLELPLKYEMYPALAREN